MQAWLCPPVQSCPQVQPVVLPRGNSFRGLMQGFLERKGLAGNVPIFMSAQESGTAGTERGCHLPVVLHQAEGDECDNFVSWERWQSWARAQSSIPIGHLGTQLAVLPHRHPSPVPPGPRSTVCHEHRCTVCWNHLPPTAARRL